VALAVDISNITDAGLLGASSEHRELGCMIARLFLEIYEMKVS